MTMVKADSVRATRLLDRCEWSKVICLWNDNMDRTLLKAEEV
jgi:hypothetical protein